MAEKDEEKIEEEIKEHLNKVASLTDLLHGYCTMEIKVGDFSKKVTYKPPVDKVSELDKYFVKKLDECSKKYGRASYTNIWIHSEKTMFIIELPWEYPGSVKLLSEEYEQEVWQPFLKDLALKFDFDPVYEEKGRYWVDIEPYNHSNVNKRMRDLEAFLSTCQKTSVRVNTLYEEQRKMYGKKLSEIIKIR